MISELSSDKAASDAQADIIAKKISAAIAKPYVLEIQRAGKQGTTIEHRCTASIGVVLFIDHDASQDDIMKWADSAMYRAKEAGRNSIQFYEPSTGVVART